MSTRKRSYQSGWLLRLVGILFAGALVIASGTLRLASAQSTDDPWTEPLNLSRSGAATNPAIVIDSDAVVHLVWQDEFANYVYTRFEDDHWSAPQATDLHLLFELPASQAITGLSQALLQTGPNPLFMAGHGQYVFAFWITPQGSLYTSRVFNRNFMAIAAWDEPILISSSAVSFAAAIDARGGLHLAYIRTVEDSENLAGIYYTRSQDNGLGWTVPALLYQSPYLRRLVGGEANLSLATAGTADAPLIYIAWDNRPRKQVLLAKSEDGGVSWEEPMQVAGPAPGSGLAGPFNIRVGATENRAVLVWQSGQPGGACTQFFQSSSDAGSSWSEAQSMIEYLSGCAQVNEFVTGQTANSRGLLYLLTNIKSQIFLLAWNGFQWSQPQAQPILSGFEDTEIYTQVVYDCHRATLYGERLYIVGCDQGGGGDIWATSREVESAESWFSPPVWSQPSPISSNDLEVAAIELVATEDGLFHALFSQHKDSAIYYTRWDGATWSRITPVLQLPDGEAGWPAVAAGPGNLLFLIARSSKGSLYYSRAKSSDAINASGWSTPARLRIAHDGRVSPADVAWDSAGTVNIAYSVPVNDERGVYLVQSKDQGKTWSEPLQVFNGAAAGFDLVGSPSLLASADGFMHIIWKRQSIQVDGVSQPLSLYYARSEDAGQTFGKAELVVEAPLAWREIVADTEGNLHRLWQRSDMMTTLLDQVSFDGGRSWQVVQRLPAEGGIAAVAVDTVSRLHLLGAGLSSLGHWLWDGSRWQAEAPLHLSLASQQEGPVELLAAAVNKDGKMVVVLALPTGTDDAAERLLLSATRTLDLPPRQTMIQETPTQSPPSPTNPIATPPSNSSLTPVATVDRGLASLQDLIDHNNTSDPMAPFAGALLPVALLLLSVLGIVALRAARAR